MSLKGVTSWFCVCWKNCKADSAAPKGRSAFVGVRSVDGGRLLMLLGCGRQSLPLPPPDSLLPLGTPFSRD